MKRYVFIIIGAGSAGRSAAETLVKGGGGRSILLLDSEPCLPYKRTQVSKNVYRKFSPDDFAIHNLSWYRDKGIDLQTGIKVTELNPRDRTIQVGGKVVGFEFLLLATGARPRIPFPNVPSQGFSTLWTLQDADSLRLRLSGQGHIAVVGGGVLGVEILWQARKMGLSASLLGRHDRLLPKYLDKMTSELLEKSLASSGAEFLPNRQVVKITRSPKGRGVLLETHKESLKFDFIVLAAGSEPNISLANEAGLDISRGIRVNQELKTSAQGIWAAGDCAEHPGGVVTGLWHAAEHQGELAALSMLGKKASKVLPPYRLKIDVFGGTWFSAGPVIAPDGFDSINAPETWEAGGILWRPRFRHNILTALSGAAPTGMNKVLMKAAQNLLLDNANKKEARDMLLESPGFPGGSAVRIT